MSLTINIGGDFCIEPPFVNNPLLTDSIKSLYQSEAINIVNLECPVNNHGDKNKILKHGPHLQTTEAVFNQLQQLNITGVTLANNHLLDYGTQGVLDTIAGCKKNNILYTGAGKNLEEAKQYLLIKKNGFTIAVINCCEHEWSVATSASAGANPLDLIDNFNAIKTAKQSADFVLMIIHGGNELYNLPRPALKKMFRFFADSGADAIISHHTHTISGYEVYNSVPIFYGTGNMLFTKKSAYKGWYTGLTVQLQLEKNKPVQFRLFPTLQSETDNSVSVAEGIEKEKILEETEKLSAIIANDVQLEDAWKQLAEQRAQQYLYHFSPVAAMPGRYVKSALRRMGFVNTLSSPAYIAGILNYINCESHADLSAQVLKNKLQKK